MLLRCRPSHRLLRSFHSTQTRPAQPSDPTAIDRPSDRVDVCIVGAGPAGLSAAIRLKQLERDHGRDIRVVVLEKGPEVGSHILSGAVIEPRALNELLPDWRSRRDHPLTQPTTHSSLRFLTTNWSTPIPQPPQMAKLGTYVISLSRLTTWLASIAEEMGVEIYPGFAAASLLYSQDAKSILGVRTNDVGLDRKGHFKDSFEPGMDFHAPLTLLAEGAHGSLSKELIRRFNLRHGRDPQTYGLGLKEVWRLDPTNHRPGKVVHTLGWPLDYKTYGGGWAYHMDDGLLTLGLVVALDYSNPYLSPYREFQRLKHHPYFRDLLSGNATRLAYGARVLNEGGLQSVPKLNVPGAALIGCSAGFMNAAKIKGTHNAMKSGMLAAEAAYDALASSNSTPADMSAYDTALHDSWVHSDLHEVRNVRPSFNTSLGRWGGIIYSGIDTLFLRGRTPWTFRNSSGTSDAAHTKPARECDPIEYPPFEPPLSTDLLTSLSLTGTNHTEDQPVHLRVRRYRATKQVAGAEGRDPQRVMETEEWSEDAHVRREHVRVNVEEYAGLLGRGCPAQVYEYVDVDEESAKSNSEIAESVENVGWGGKKLVINSQNCIHCKFCDVKVPTQDITWTVPEGGGGPKYS